MIAPLPPPPPLGYWYHNEWWLELRHRMLEKDCDPSVKVLGEWVAREVRCLFNFRHGSNKWRAFFGFITRSLDIGSLSWYQQDFFFLFKPFLASEYCPHACCLTVIRMKCQLNATCRQKLSQQSARRERRGTKVEI